jgi:Leucine-rich repeat (LRR) protein
MCIKCETEWDTGEIAYWCGSVPDLPKGAELKENIGCKRVNYIPYSEYLKTLYCKFCDITQYHAFPNLTKLEISGTLDISKNKLKYELLNAGFIPIDIPSMPNLVELIVYEAFIIKINNHPKLERLNCSYTFVEELPEYMPTLKTLLCSRTKITKLPNMPNIETLEIDNTAVSHLGYYPKLKSLDCSDTLITELPYDMPHLQLLNCEFTKISKLPYIPEVWHLNIGDSLITELPSYELHNLETLDIDNTKISRLPPPDNWYIERLSMVNTYITMLPYYKHCQEIDNDDAIFADPQYYENWYQNDVKHPIDTLIKLQKNIKFQIHKRNIRRVGIIIYRNCKIYDLKAACRFADRVVEFLG